MSRNGLRQCLASAGLLALCACGSKGSGSPPVEYAPFAYAYVASTASDPSSAGAIYEYALMSDSSVAPLPQASVRAGVDPAAVVVAHGHVYAVNVGDGTISQYDIESDETLQPMNPSTVTNPGMHTFGAAPVTAIVDPTGSFLYVTNAADATVSQFSIGGDGGLTPLTPATVATGVDPVSIVVGFLADSTPVYYVVNSGAAAETGSVSLYSSEANGALTPMTSATIAAGTNPSAMAINSISATAYVMSNCDGTQCLGSIRQFGVGSSGELTDTGAIVTTASHNDAVNMVIDQDGASLYAYVLSRAMGVDTNAGALWQYRVASTGALSAADPPMLDLGSVPVAQVIHVNGLYVLTTNSGASATTPSTGGNLDFYTLAAGGAATLNSSATLSAPYPVAMALLFPLAP
jgi:6-phosphogluconolactonase (cycloisomerase 2 family)